MAFNGYLSPRESGIWVKSKAKHVTIPEAGVKRCAEEIVARLASGQISLEGLYTKTDIHPQEANRAGVDWVFFTDTINFSFWSGSQEPKYKVTYKGKTYTGYLSLCAAVNRTLDQGIALTDPGFYGKLKEEELNQYLMGDDQVPIPMLKQRVQCLREVGEVLLRKFGGSFEECLKASDKSAEKLLQLVLEHFPCFRDQAEFDGKKVSLLKRAQILVSDVWALFEGKGLADFQDIDTLTMFSDYRVPQSLQFFGALSYSPELLAVLKKEELLPNGSPNEVEIRGCSIYAVDEIVKKVRELSPDARINCALVDYFLWSFRREKAKEMDVFPYHKTRSIYY